MHNHRFAIGLPTSFLAFFLLFSTGAISAPAEETAPLDATVAYLLKQTKASGATFVRNGKKHTAAKAADHMKKKYEHFLKKKEIKTAEDFIRLAATKSLVTGKIYKLKQADGTEQKTADWMRTQLKQYRAGKTGQ